MTNNTESIKKEMVLTAVVRTFFKYFTLGVIEANAEDKEDMSVYEPKQVKQTMIEHYEDVSRVFNQEAFYIISRLNYAEEELETELKAFVADGNKTTAMELMRFACRHESLYNIMVSEYKRNFEALLCGVFNSTANTTDSASDENTNAAKAENTSETKTENASETKDESKAEAEIGAVEYELAEALINRMANVSYTEGGKLKTKLK